MSITKFHLKARDGTVRVIRLPYINNNATFFFFFRSDQMFRRVAILSEVFFFFSFCPHNEPVPGAAGVAVQADGLPRAEGPVLGAGHGQQRLRRHLRIRTDQLVVEEVHGVVCNKEEEEEEEMGQVRRGWKQTCCSGNPAHWP